MGGHAFGSTVPIAKENIKPTLRAFFRELNRIFPEASQYFQDDSVVLGSTGKSAVSNDIDLGISIDSCKYPETWGLDRSVVREYYRKFIRTKANTTSDEQVKRRAFLTAIADKIRENSNIIRLNTKGIPKGAIYLQFPQVGPKGNFLDKVVQIDLNFGYIPWLVFSCHSEPYQGNIKGLHRTELVSQLFENKGYHFSHSYGIKNAETGELVTNDPKEAVELLNKLYSFNLDQNTLNNYHSLEEFLEKHLDEEELHKIWDEYLKVLDKKRCDIPNDLQSYWLDNQERLELAGKYLPSSSKLFSFKA